MRTLICTVFVCAAVFSSQEAPLEPVQASSVTIEYVAHACFRVTAPSGDRILIDPFASRVWLGYDYPSGIEAGTVLITHPHYDHDGGVAIGRPAPWVKGTRVLRKPGSYEVGEVKILGIAGKHAGPWGKEFGQTNTIWLLEVAGLRIAHLGDNGPVSEEAKEQLGRVDLLLMPIDSEYHILKRHEIEDILEAVAPTVVVPMHYRHPDLETDKSSPEDLGGIDGWLKKRKGVRYLESHRLRVSTESLPQKQEVLVFKHWPDMGPPQ